MILFNTTLSVDPSVENEWLEWVEQEMIPQIKQTGYFTSVEVYLLMNEIPEAPGNTFTLQCYCEKRSQLEEYQEHYASSHMAQIQNAFPNKVVAFQTFLRRVIA